MSTITLRDTGTYKIEIEVETGRYFCNGHMAEVAIPEERTLTSRGEIVALVNTGDKNGQGGYILVGLTRAEVNLVHVARKAEADRKAAKYYAENREEVDRRRERARLAAEHDKMFNEGGEGYNPYRDTRGDDTGDHGHDAGDR